MNSKSTFKFKADPDDDKNMYPTLMYIANLGMLFTDTDLYTELWGYEWADIYNHKEWL